MKKILFTIALAFTAIQFSNAQISFGVKGGMNTDLNSEASKYIDLPSGFNLETDKSSGYHAGIWLRVKVPIVGLYVRPEINFTSLTSEYIIGLPTITAAGLTTPALNANAKFEINKIDVPVLLGLKVLKFGNVFIGPNFQYLIKSDLTASADAPLDSFSYSNDEVDNEISVGFVAGVGLEIWKLGLDVRFETGFNIPDENLSNLNTFGAEEAITKISNALSNQRPNQIIIGLSYKF